MPVARLCLVEGAGGRASKWHYQAEPGNENEKAIASQGAIAFKYQQQTNLVVVMLTVMVMMVMTMMMIMAMSVIALSLSHCQRWIYRQSLL